MKNTFEKYFANELSSQEKTKFLLEVANNTDLKEEFIEYQQLMAHIALLPWKTDDEEAKQGLSRFMSRTGNK